MGNPIVKLEGQYLIWSTISDRPESYGMTLVQLIAHVREEDGRRGVEALKERLTRVEAKGTSSHDDRDADDTMWLNRAGPIEDGEESPLHREEIIEFYIRRRIESNATDLKTLREGLARCGPKCPSIEVNGCASFCRRCWGTDYVRESDQKGSDPR